MTEGDNGASSGTGAAAGDGVAAGAAAAAGGAGAAATSWTASLPEAIRGNEAWKDVPDVGTLANRYLDTRKPFAEQLPEKIRGEAAFKDIKDLGGLADSYLNAQKLIGVPKDQILRLPTGEEAKDWDPVWNRLGRPEKAADYKVTPPEGIQINEALKEPMFQKAHELGVSNKQLNGMYNWWVEVGMNAAKTQQAAAAADQAKGITTLKTEWGAAYDQKMGDIHATVEFLESKYPGLKEVFDKTRIGDHPALSKFYADYAQTLREDGKLTGRATGAGGGILSPTEALQAINALNQDQSFTKPYFNKSDPGHKAAVEKREALYKLAYPEQQRQAG